MRHCAIDAYILDSSLRYCNDYLRLCSLCHRLLVALLCLLLLLDVLLILLLFHRPPSAGCRGKNVACNVTVPGVEFVPVRRGAAERTKRCDVHECETMGRSDDGGTRACICVYIAMNAIAICDV